MRILLVGLVSLFLINAARAEFPLTPASTREDILDAINARGQGLKDFTADVSLATADALGGDPTKLVGKVWHQSKLSVDNGMTCVSENRYSAIAALCSRGIEMRQIDPL